MVLLWACNSILDHDPGTLAGDHGGVDGGVTPTAGAGEEGEGGVADGAAAPPAGEGLAHFEVVAVGPGTGSLNAIWGANSRLVYAVGDDGLVLRYDGELPWTRSYPARGVRLGGVSGTTGSDVYAVGTSVTTGRGVILHFDGAEWITETEVPEGLITVWADPVTMTVYAGGLKGVVYKKTVTKPWYKLITLTPNPNIALYNNAPVLWQIAGAAADNLMIAADENTTFYFRGMSQWVPLYDSQDRTRAFYSAWAPKVAGGPGQYYVGANYYGIWLMTGGDTVALQLAEEKSETTKDKRIWGIWGQTSSRVVFVGDAGRIMVYRGGEVPPQVAPSPTTVGLSAVWGSSLDDVWIVGDGETVLHGNVAR